MSNQQPPPRRPLFRFAPLARQAQSQQPPRAQAPAPQAQLRPPPQFSRPAMIRTSSRTPFLPAFRPVASTVQRPSPNSSPPTTTKPTTNTTTPPPPAPTEPNTTTPPPAPIEPNTTPSILGTINPAREAPKSPMIFHTRITTPPSPITSSSSSSPLHQPSSPHDALMRRSPEYYSESHHPKTVTAAAPSAAQGSPISAPSSPIFPVKSSAARPDHPAASNYSPINYPDEHIVKPIPSPFTLPLPPPSPKSSSTYHHQDPTSLTQAAQPNRKMIANYASKADYQKSITTNYGQDNKASLGAGAGGSWKFLDTDHEDSSSTAGGGWKIINIAGDNRGAVMELNTTARFSPPPRKHIIKKGINTTTTNSLINSTNQDNYITASVGGPSGNAVESEPDALPSNQMKSDGIISNSATATTRSKNDHLQRRNPYVINSNVQAVNSSIMFNSTCVSQDPGIHLSFSPRPRPFKTKGIRSDLDHQSRNQF